ncbi:hypothetical protein G8S49_03175 [Clostridium botulinum C]|uniref:Uncharacterized protein n=3 Tax=Clostridium botulinum TaxID=1491 RepID=A0A9Q4TNI2_CLOBO|nr:MULTISPECIES: hypothetical protein [Clostridium]EGO87220.1 hypothetical protein CBCST_13322 [Clostridium botulinum C str. Stockholm]MBO3442350.1 hypothetical protein [Clostridium haemolyticum]MCD3194543.1 hypothetical protein [Clostridium botulinum C]AYF54612.1 hypothetical protein DFH04_07820 [Clostridium novyi]EES90846.1 conserved hypothetical protein [Clostridium botulinum D str. 1873]
MKKVLTLRQKYMIEKGVYGSMWLSTAALRFMKFQVNNSKIIYGVLLTYLFIGCIPIFMKTEKEDEMSVHNNNKARLVIYDKLISVIFFCTFLGIFIIKKDKWMIDLNLLLPFVLGVINLMEFILFVFYEKVGDKYGEIKDKNS